MYIYLPQSFPSLWDLVLSSPDASVALLQTAVVVHSIAFKTVVCYGRVSDISYSFIARSARLAFNFIIYIFAPKDILGMLSMLLNKFLNVTFSFYIICHCNECIMDDYSISPILRAFRLLPVFHYFGL